MEKTLAVFQLLSQALTPDPALQRSAEQQLSQWEGQQGFCGCLAEIIASKDASVTRDVRFLAAVCLKNAVNRHWRPRRDSQGIPDHEKRQLREALLHMACDRDPQIALQLALTLARVARFDIPRDWPQLLPALASQLQSQDALTAVRCYLVLHHVLKELSTKRLAADQLVFAQAAGLVFDSVWAQWCADTQTLAAGIPAALAAGPPELAQAAIAAERWLLALKALRRCALFGAPTDARSLREAPMVARAAPAMAEALGGLLPLCAALQRAPAPLPPALGSFGERACLKLAKTLGDVLAAHPITFRACGALRASVQLALRHGLGEPAHPGGEAPPRRVQVQAMLLLQAALRAPAYQQPGQGHQQSALPPEDQTIPEQVALEQRMRAEGAAEMAALLPGEARARLAVALVERHFALTQPELEAWSADPEAFQADQVSEAWSEQTRPCAEQLFLALLELDRAGVAPGILRHVAAAAAACPGGGAASSMSAALELDAAYNALGIASYELFDYVDFSSLANGAIFPELMGRDPAARVLRRRCAWLLGQWVTKLADAQKADAYRALAALLANEPDAAVRLAAAASLRTLVDDFGFRQDLFSEVAPVCIQGLLRLAAGSREADTQSSACMAASVVLERLGPAARPLAPAVLAVAPAIWAASEGQSMLRIQIITVLCRAVAVLGPESEAAAPVVVPVVAAATAAGSPDEAALLEDGLTLWEAALRHAPRPQPALLQLFPRLPALLDRSFEHLPAALRIVESYLLLDGAAFLQHHGAALSRAFEAAAGAVSERGTLLLLPVIDRALACFPQAAPVALEAPLIKLLRGAARGTETDLVAANICCLFGRILLQTPSLFFELLRRAGAAGAFPAAAGSAGAPGGGAGNPLGPPDPLLAFVELWADKTDCLSCAGKRKLSALAMVRLLSEPDPRALQCVESAAVVVTSALAEEAAGGEDAGGSWEAELVALRAAGGAGDEDEGAGQEEVSEEGAEGARRHAATHGDVVKRLPLKQTVVEALRAAAAAHGAAALGAALRRVDPSILRQLETHCGSKLVEAG